MESFGSGSGVKDIATDYQKGILRFILENGEVREIDLFKVFEDRLENIIQNVFEKMSHD